MAAIYSTKFWDAHEPSSAVEYVVPDGFVAVVRCVTIFLSIDFTGHVEVLSGSGATWIQQTGSLPNTDTFVWNGRQVFVAGESFGLGWDAITGSFDSLCSGYLLTAP